jgi:hypothetical protein
MASLLGWRMASASGLALGLTITSKVRPRDFEVSQFPVAPLPTGPPRTRERLANVGTYFSTFMN